MEINIIKKMLLAGSKNILDNKQTLNDMNVFPIPDGDTGTNMDKTMHGIVKVLMEIGDRDLTPTDFDDLYKSALMNSQGNSGVILSQWLKGFLKTLRDETELDTGILDAAFIGGTQSAYSSVADPVEGTFLTVCREAQEEAEDQFDEDTSVYDFMKNVVDAASASLKRTPDKLPILKEYDVLDSGGMGFLCLVTGMFTALDEDYKYDFSEFESLKPSFSANGTLGSSASGEEFGYCTELIVSIDEDKLKGFNPDNVRIDMNSFGNSLVLVQDGTALKIHIHTLKPEDVLTYFHKFGEFTKLKIENMTLQHHENFLAATQDCAIVAVADGDGIEELYRSLGVKEIIRGGQSDNVSVQNMLNACKKASAKHVILLPNNKNIIMTAEKVRELCTESVIHIVPTRSMAEGYCALSLIDASASYETIEKTMLDSLKGVHTGFVSVADKSGVYNGIDVKAGDHIGVLDDDVIVCSASDTIAALKELTKRIPGIAEAESVTIFAGTYVVKSSVESNEYVIKNFCPDAEINVAYGGQGIYDLVVLYQ
ncbi:MAG: DAK2 domain-containing protein [Clostridiales bacterium]|nr:DAK2 domain-containing protein [Clostridiales bacterium]